MDVAKYIGLFLLKNHSCYIHGLGNIEWRTKPATYDGRNLVPGVHEVAVVPAGTVDDSLSNFIATNEQISISKATNAVRDFSNEAKESLQAGKEVVIPSLGSFVEVNGKLQFNTAYFLQQTPAPILAEKGKPRRAEESSQKPVQGTTETLSMPAYTNPVNVQPGVANYEIPEQPKAGLNWGRIILFILLLALLIGGIGYAVKNMMGVGSGMRNDTTAVPKAVTPVQAPASNELPQQIDSAAADTTPLAVPDAKGMISFKVILNTYEQKAKAEKRVQRLRSYGNTVELISEDSNLHYVVMPITSLPADKQKVMDSLKRNFNPDGVAEY